MRGRHPLKKFNFSTGLKWMATSELHEMIIKNIRFWSLLNFYGLQSVSYLHHFFFWGGGGREREARLWMGSTRSPRHMPSFWIAYDLVHLRAVARAGVWKRRNSTMLFIGMIKITITKSKKPHVKHNKLNYYSVLLKNFWKYYKHVRIKRGRKFEQLGISNKKDQ